ESNVPSNSPGQACLRDQGLSGISEFSDQAGPRNRRAKRETGPRSQASLHAQQTRDCPAQEPNVPPKSPGQAGLPEQGLSGIPKLSDQAGLRNPRSLKQCIRNVEKERYPSRILAGSTTASNLINRGASGTPKIVGKQHPQNRGASGKRHLQNREASGTPKIVRQAALPKSWGKQHAQNRGASSIPKIVGQAASDPINCGASGSLQIWGKRTATSKSPGKQHPQNRGASGCPIP
ncbi:unnamed protein product, partial [Acanthoscelides obtectus]